MTGAFVHLDTATDRLTLHDVARSQKRYVPASTFKPANALIALETGAIASLEDVIPWDGLPKRFPEWERDMTIKEAIRVSSVPVFQILAHRIGPSRYEEWLDKLGYGNATVGNAPASFWLDGPLTISAIEQTGFFAALALTELPGAFSPDHQEAVRNALLIDEKGSRKLYAKSGWNLSSKPELGWWTGWVAGDGRVDSFALNLDLKTEADLGARAEIGRACLAHLGIY